MTAQYAYSPHTGEIIRTETISDWMGVTNIAPPTCDPATQSVFWRDGVWAVESMQPEPALVPSTVTRAQGKAALIQSGLWGSVLSYVDGMTDPTEKALAEVALNDTLDWRRDSPFLGQAAAAIGLGDEQLDDLFVAAALIEL